MADLEYIRALKLHGEQDAFRVVFMKYQPKLKGFLAKIVKSETIAEDLAQDIFVKLWSNQKLLREIDSLNSYIYTMAKYAAYDYLKGENIKARYTQTDAANVKEAESTTEQEYYAKEIDLLIRLTVSNMPPQRKKVFEMSRYQGLKNEDIAIQLQLSKKTVENHLGIALKELKQAILVFFILMQG